MKGNTADGGAWLTVSPGSGNAPSTVTVSVVTKNLPGQGLTAGTFNGQLVFTAANDVVTIPIGVVVGPNVFRQLNAISFVMPEGGANPLPQILPVVSAGTNFNFSSAVYTGRRQLAEHLQPGQRLLHNAGAITVTSTLPRCPREPIRAKSPSSSISSKPC